MPSTRTIPSVGTWKAAIRQMMVDLPGPEGTHQSGDGARIGLKIHVEKNLLARVVGKADVIEDHFSRDRAERDYALRVAVFWPLA